jgi:hypothetical protein
MGKEGQLLGHGVGLRKVMEPLLWKAVANRSHNHFNLERHFVDRQTYKTHRSAALAEWQSLMI